MRNPRRSSFVIVAPVIVATCVTILLLGTSSRTIAFNAQSGRPTPSVGHFSHGASVVIQGIPAIRPQSSAVSPTTPTFTTQDVIRYLEVNPMPHNLAVGVPVSVGQVRLLTSQQVTAILAGESTGLPDGTLVYYVDLQGTFTFGGPGAVSATYHHGYELFDAHTGNLMMWGGLSA